jgi:hypothetical protein
MFMQVLCALKSTIDLLIIISREKDIVYAGTVYPGIADKEKWIIPKAGYFASSGKVYI